MSIYTKLKSLASVVTSRAAMSLAVATLFAVGGASITQASERRLHFSGQQSGYIAKQHRKAIRYYNRNYQGKHIKRSVRVNRHSRFANTYNAPRGPKVINVSEVLSHRRLKITINRNTTVSSPLKPHILDNGPGGPRVIYYDDSKCEGGYDCVIRLGGKASSPKLIVLGTKQLSKPEGPLIIYPPSDF